MALKKNGNDCDSLTGKDPTKNAKFSVLNSDDNDGLKITYTGGATCDDTGSTYNFEIDITCDEN